MGEHNQSDTSTKETTQMEQTALEVTELTKVYSDGTLAVDNINFRVEKGDFCVLIGPSGCGKSTTLHSIIGKTNPTAGRIELNGSDITDSPIYKRNVGLVFQDFQLFPHLTVEENVKYGPERMDWSEKDLSTQVDHVLELLRIEETQNRTPTELSVGQQQRVALARSLVLEPDLLLLDEPLGDLDYKLQKSMEREFLRLHRELDTTFVYVTHDQTQAMRLGDQIIVMNEGKIEQSGSVDDVYNSPATGFVATFVGDTNIFFGQLQDVVLGENSATIITDYGTFETSTVNLRSPADQLLGEELMFAVRPQLLEITNEATNTLPCSIQDVISRPGRGTQLVLEATSNDDVSRQIQMMVYREFDVQNDTVTIGWDPEDAILIEKASVAKNINLEKDIYGE